MKINAAGTVNMVEAFYPVLAEGGMMINFSSVAAYTMPQTDEWTQAFEAWNEPDFYDRLLALAGETEGEEGEFFRAGLAYAMSKKFVICFTQKNVSRFAEKHCRILSISPGCYLTPMHQKLIDNQPEPGTSTAWTFSPTAARTPGSSSHRSDRHIKRAALRSERRPF